MYREREKEPCDLTARRPAERLARKMERHQAAGARADPSNARSHKCSEPVLREQTCWGKNCYSESDKYLLYEAE